MVVRVLAIPVSAAVAAAGAVLHGVARMMAGGRRRSIAIVTTAAAAGTIAHGMARVVGDWVAGGAHCPSIR